MSTDVIVNVSRREFLKTGGALMLGMWIPAADAQAQGGAAFEPNAFVRIGADDSVTVIAKHLEMGQGTYTGLATLVAEELDADWEQVKVEGAPADAGRYNNLFWGPSQGTGGSTAIANSYEQMRRAGATARAMLVAAAAQEWGVAPETISVNAGVLRSGKHAAKFGALAQKAATLPVPAEVALKNPKSFVLIGKPLLRKDAHEKSNGKAMFTLDVALPGMLTAVVARPPRFGAKPGSFDPARARAVPGVVDVVAIPAGVAVVANDFWSARKGRDVLRVDWDESNAFKLDSAAIMSQYRELARQQGRIARKLGDAASALTGAARRLDAEYEFPFLAHAAMEPMNCVVSLKSDGCEVWNGDQFQTADQQAVAATVGMKPEQVAIHMLYAGGSFGRRANPHSDYVVEAASIAKALADQGAGGRPVKMVWTREDDMSAGYYRPLYFHVLRAGLDAAGKPVAWLHRIVGQSILAGTPFEAVMVKDGIDTTSVEGAANLPYAVPHISVELHSPRLGVPVQWWRSVGSTHTAFSTETFIDELAAAAGKDPFEFRRSLLAAHPRHRAVLELAAREAGWGKYLAPKRIAVRRGRGIAVHESFNTFVAQVAEVSVAKDGTFSVDRVVCAVDCGVAVNPKVIAAQMEGGIAYGLSAALYGAITLKQGKVEQSNFHDYPVLRIGAMPRVEVHIVRSAEKPSGVGEPATPVIAPAVANALAAATGRRLRALPFEKAMLRHG